MAEAGRIPVGAPARPDPVWRQLATAVAISLVLGLLLLGGYRLAVDHLRHSRPGHIAQSIVRTSPQLRTLLGEPLRQKMEAGEVPEDSPTAEFTFTAQGPKGSADVELSLRKEGGAWRFVQGTIETDEGLIPLEPPSPPAPRAPAAR